MIFKWGKCTCGKKYMVSKPRKCSCGNDLSLSDEWSVRYTNKGKTVVKQVSTRKRDAEDYLANIRVSVRSGALLPGEERDISWEDATKSFKKWFDLDTIRQNTKNQYTNSIKRLSEYFGLFNLQEIERSHIAAYQAVRIKDHKPATVNREIATLKRMLSLHCEWNSAKKHPKLHAANAEVKSASLLPENNMQTRFLTECEAKLFLSCCNPRTKIIVTVALYTGLRLRNILRLKWSQISQDSITFSAEEMKGGEHFTLPLHPALSSALKRWRLETGRLSEHVFLSRHGKVSPHITKSFDKARTASGLQDFTFHTLRHTFASNFILNGGDITTLSRLLGHSDVSITAKRYVHLTKEHKMDSIIKYGMAL